MNRYFATPTAWQRPFPRAATGVVCILLLACIGAVPAPDGLSARPAMAQETASRSDAVLITDLLKVRRLGDVEVSPDGRQVLYTVTRIVESEEDSLVYRTHIYLVDAAGNAPPRQLTRGTESASDPTWHPDGDRIAFVRSVDGKSQIFVLSLLGGEAEQITNIESGASNPRWSPDGTRILFASSLPEKDLAERLGHGPAWPLERPGRAWGDAEHVQPDPNGSIAEIRAWLEKNAEDGDPRVFHRLNLHAEHDLEPHPTFRHFFVAYADSSAEPVMVTSGYNDFGSGEWLSDDRIVLSGIVPDDEHPDRVLGSKLYLASADGESVTPYFEMDGYAVYAPTLSPDGRRLAFVARDDEDRGYAQSELGVLSVSNPSDAVLLTLSFDRSISSPRWSEDGWFVYFTARSNGGVPLYRVHPFESFAAGDTMSVERDTTAVDDTTVVWNTTAVDDTTARDDTTAAARDTTALGSTTAAGVDTTGVPDEPTAAGERSGDSAALRIEVERLTSFERGVQSFDLGRATVFYVATEVATPYELYGSNLPFTSETRRTAHNADWLSGKRLSVPERHTLVRDSVEVEYWIMKPVNFDSTRRYPLLVQIHGGPSAMWGPGEATMWHEFQFFASKGYAVVFSNPRGSGGYGYEFKRGNYQDWGSGPAQDVLAAATEAASRPWIDADRQVVTGGSYAGYLTAWIVAHDHRFKAAAAQRGVYDLDTFLGEGNAWRLVPTHFGGFPWETEADTSANAPPPPSDVLERNSPITYVDRITTPLLIMHSDRDLRTGVIQSEVLYKSLKILDRPVEYVRYPKAGHDLSRSGNPKQRMDRILRIYEFFERFIR